MPLLVSALIRCKSFVFQSNMTCILKRVWLTFKSLLTMLSWVKKKEKTIKCKQKSIPLISLLRVFPCFEQLHKFTYSFDWPDVNALGFVSLCSRKTKLWGVMYFWEYQFFYLNIRQQTWFYFPSRWQDLHYERCFFLWKWWSI